ncbi:MAG: hypothetical protein OXC41_01740 [Gammaproteobacteria bacterium]|nr:hypothetical protein [Gammaproteobacteria bacterium]
MFKLSYAVMLLVLAVIVSNPAMSGSTSPPKVTAADCKSGWSSTSASNSCNLLNHWVNNNKCSFFASCTYMRHAQVEDRKRSTVTGLDKGGEVSNCSGTLTKGSC